MEINHYARAYNNAIVFEVLSSRGFYFRVNFRPQLDGLRAASEKPNRALSWDQSHD